MRGSCAPEGLVALGPVSARQSVQVMSRLVASRQAVLRQSSRVGCVLFRPVPARRGSCVGAWSVGPGTACLVEVECTWLVQFAPGLAWQSW